MTDHSKLRVLNESGEIIGTVEDFTQPLEDQIAGLQRDIRGWAARNAELRREKPPASGHPRYREAKDAFDLWRRKCNHPRSRFTDDRFERVLPFLEKYGMATIIKAIEGAAYDPWETKRKNGTMKRHDGWELIFRDAGQVEEFANKAPRRQVALA